MSDNNFPFRSELLPGEVIPAFTLPGADGMPHGPWDYKQRDNLVLLFVRGMATSEERGLVRAFASHYSEFRTEQCAILVITADPVIVNLQVQEELHLPFPLLADPKGAVISRYTRWNGTTHAVTPCIVLTDRYGALCQQWHATNEAELPPISDLLASLQYLNSLCTP